MKKSENLTIRNGVLSFENYFGETLSYVEIYHTKRMYSAMPQVRLYNIPNETKVANIFNFKYQLGWGALVEFWKIAFLTASGQQYRSKEDFTCAIRAEDDGHVIIGVNGESKRMYVSFSSSSSCSTGLY